MKILTVIGARPQFIKAAAVARVAATIPDVSEVIVHTGQHYDANMSRIFFEELEISEPAYNLGVGSESHGKQTGRMLELIEEVLLSERPDWVLVYGDTNSTLAGALAASKLHLPIAHIEAGLRSFNRQMPEEVNRVLTDHASDLLFAPTDKAVSQLREEGISADRILQVGDVMFDVACYFGDKADKESRILTELGIEGGNYILATIHRAENTDALDRLSAIFKGLIAVAKHERVVLPLHPRTHRVLKEQGMYESVAEALTIVPPLGYLDMVMLEKHALVIVTDSGGLQKEAFFHGVPCVILREETEWVELVEARWNTLCPPTSPDIITDIIKGAIWDKIGYSPATLPQLYGDGKSSHRILEALLHRGSMTFV